MVTYACIGKCLMKGVESVGYQLGQCQRIWHAVRVQVLLFLHISYRADPSF